MKFQEIKIGQCAYFPEEGYTALKISATEAVAFSGAVRDESGHLHKWQDGPIIFAINPTAKAIKATAPKKGKKQAELRMFENFKKALDLARAKAAK